MFTGIVRERGRVVAAEPNGGGVHLRIAAPETAGAALGDSIAVSGCCLTVTAASGETLEFDAVPETIARTTLGGLGPGAEVNLEPALRAGEPLGGHFVQGHVDGRARVTSARPGGRRCAAAPPARARAAPVLRREGLDRARRRLAHDRRPRTRTASTIALVPFTLAHTTLGALAPGDEVNVEVDLLAKYAERLASA